MTANVAPTPVQRFVDTSTGAALVGGLLYTYAAGTSTPQATYTDSTAGTPNTNPVVLNSRGECNLWLSPSQYYKIVLKTSAGVTIWTVDNFSGSPAGLSSLVTFQQAETGAVLRNAQDKMRERKTTPDYDTLAHLISAATTPRLIGASTYAAATTIGNQWVMGEKGATLTGPGLTFSTGTDFYDFGMDKVGLVGTGAASETGLTINKGHRGLFTSVPISGYNGANAQGLRLVDAYINQLVGVASTLNSYGGLIEQNSNASLLAGCSFTNNTNTGLTIRGSYSVTSFSCDYEVNTDGLIFGNLTLSGAEPRVNRSIADYFEGNVSNDIWIGDQSSTDRARGTIVAYPYFQAGSGTVTGIKVQYSDSARILWPYFATTYSNTKIFLRDASRNTTIIPFPQGDSTIATSEISVEANATVSPQTIQWNTATLTLDGAGVGFVDVAYKVKQETLTPPIVQFYSTTDRATVAPILLVNSVTTTGFRVRCPTGGGGTALEVLKFFWRAGA